MLFTIYQKLFLMGLAFIASAHIALAQETPPAMSGKGIPDDALVSLTIHPAAMVADPDLKMMPWEVVQAAGLDALGIDPLLIDEIKLVVGPVGPAGALAGATVHFTEPVAVTDLNPDMVIQERPAKVSGRDAFPIVQTPDWYISQVDEQTILLGSKAYMPSIERADGKTGPLANIMSRMQTPEMAVALVAIEPVRDLLRGGLQAGFQQAPPNIPQAIRDLAAIPDLLDFIMIRIVKVNGALGLQITLVSPDESSATNLSELLTSAVDAGREMMISEMENEAPDDPTAQAMIKYVKRIAPDVSKMLLPVQDGRRLTMTIDNSMGGTATIGVLTGLLLPAVQASREAARRMQSSNNLKQIGLAMHNYADAYRKFPEPASKDKDGKPLLSWRVAILPFIEEAALYNEFHLDEPWDSEHNIALLDRMPETFRHPRSLAEPGTTVYQVITGEEIGLDSEGPTRFQMITDGTSNTIMAIEVPDEYAVPWTKPEDVEIDPDDPAANLGGQAAGGFNALFFDGSVRFISESIDADMLWKLMTRGGGEVVNGF